MRISVIGMLLSLAVVMSVGAQTSASNHTISITFAIDGKTVPCQDRKIELRMGEARIAPQPTEKGFVVPVVFDKRSTNNSSREENKIEISIVCGEYTFNFPGLHPGWVSAGTWTIGIVHPPYWFETFGGTEAIERGTWLSYLESECNGCDPGVITSVSHPDPPPILVNRLRQEQSISLGERARDIAYALAVFGVEQQENRNYLLGLLKACLSRPKDSPEDDVCNGRLLEYITNLYWRGDTELLAPLLAAADSPNDVVSEIGTFYAGMLDRRSTIFLNRLVGVPIEKQQTACRLAAEDDLSLDSPKLRRVVGQLHAANTEIAERCLQAVEAGAKRPFGQKP